jgi:hypothetical protein
MWRRVPAMGKLVLSEVLASIDKFEPHLIVYVANDQELCPGSDVELVDYVGPQTQKPLGKRHLLSVHDIRVILDTWSKWRGGRVPDDRERCEAVAFYAKYDGYIPVT